MPDGRPTIGWMEKHGKLVIALALGGTALFYVVQQVNPETIQAFKVEQALAEYQREVRWCIVKATVESGAATTEEVLTCLERP